jgi:hypothetical protein
LKAVILVSLLTLPFSATAQTPRGEQPFVSDFRACVRSHTADAQAAGVRTANEAEDYFFKACIPPLFELIPGSGSFLPPSNNIAMGESVPPGLFRTIVREEWRDFIEQRNKQ